MKSNILGSDGKYLDSVENVFMMDSGRNDPPVYRIKTKLNADQFDLAWAAWVKKWKKHYPSYPCPKEYMRVPYSNLTETFEGFAEEFLESRGSK